MQAEQEQANELANMTMQGYELVGWPWIDARCSLKYH